MTSCAGLDLQEEVFHHRKQGGKATGTHIDHRRVPNIGAYLADHPHWTALKTKAEPRSIQVRPQGYQNKILNSGSRMMVNVKLENDPSRTEYPCAS